MRDRYGSLMSDGIHLQRSCIVTEWMICQCMHTVQLEGEREGERR